MTPALFAVLLASAVNAPAPPDEAIKPPQGLPPTQVIASVTKDGEFEITQTRLVPARHTEERTTAAGVKYTVQVVSYRPVQETRRIKGEGVKVYTTAGKEVSPKDVPDKLRKPAIVLLAADGKKVDPFYLKIIKSDTLVLVAPVMAAPAAVAPPTPPTDKPPAGAAEEAARAAERREEAAKRDEEAKRAKEEAARAEAAKRAAEKKPK
jgi:hypothetical protein